MPSVSTDRDPRSGSESGSGIIFTPTGDRHIPSSTRPDGSKRKEIKIRPGYKPPEDVEVYKNRTAEAWKTRGTGGVPGAAVLDQEADGKAASGKNAKRREARKKAKAVEEDGDEGAKVNDRSKEQNEITAKPAPRAENWRAQTPTDGEAEEPLDTEAEKEKQARNLKKKLRQARELREKKDKGENLLPEQFAKVIKISELIRQLDGLGFNTDGEAKVGTDQGKKR